MSAFAMGAIVGFLFHRALVCWGAMWRVCCREHYATRATCQCRDCARDREAGVEA